jgi:PadR family transcriptional regulator, regulatory protein AphA
MRSPVNWALLGLVIQRPSSGYELVQRFERTFETALELSSPSQVYTALDTLARKGLIEEMPGPQDRDGVRQPKPHYQVTEEGLRGYSAWLLTQMEEERRRRRLFAQQLALLGPSAALEVIDRCEQACLEEATAMPTVGRAEPSGDRASGLVERLVSEEDRLRMGARLAWIQYARSELKALL